MTDAQLPRYENPNVPPRTPQAVRMVPRRWSRLSRNPNRLRRQYHLLCHRIGSLPRLEERNLGRALRPLNPPLSPTMLTGLGKDLSSTKPTPTLADHSQTKGLVRPPHSLTTLGLRGEVGHLLTTRMDNHSPAMHGRLPMTPTTTMEEHSLTILTDLVTADRLPMTLTASERLHRSLTMPRRTGLATILILLLEVDPLLMMHLLRASHRNHLSRIRDSSMLIKVSALRSCAIQ